jgi:hypothetical protein
MVKKIEPGRLYIEPIKNDVVVVDNIEEISDSVWYHHINRPDFPVVEGALGLAKMYWKDIQHENTNR